MKVAIMGGGVGAMTAAYWLTNPPESGGPAEPVDVTVYQMGWRLGGKGASGRNMAEAARIEEHGMHAWFGFYANAFRMIRHVYEELNRPSWMPLSTWRDAFKPQTVVTFMETGRNGKWLPEWVFAAPLRPGTPGDQMSFPKPWQYLPRLPDLVRQRIDEFLEGKHHDACKWHDVDASHIEHLHLIRAGVAQGCGHAGTADAPPSKAGREIFILCLEGVQKLIGIGLDRTNNCVSLNRLLQIADLLVAVALGIARDLVDGPWDSIDDLDWRSWLSTNGLHQVTFNGSLTRGVYDLAFGYLDGDPSKPDLAAGTTTCGTLRMVLDYDDAFLFKMQAGMGDTIFAPIYELLRRRGVHFRFFHRLREVVPSADGTNIESLRFGVQATTWGDAEYHPLIPVNNLPCWPSTPLYDQLVQGAELRAQHVDLEAYDWPWPDVGELTLTRNDFDLAVFGLSVGAVPYVCPRLVEQNPRWRAMIERVKTVRTQAFQLWLSRNIAGLGYPPALNGRCYGERALVGAWLEPMAMWADMSQLIPREAWNVPMNNIAYFCGVMADGPLGPGLPVPAATQKVIDYAYSILTNDIGTLWPDAAPNGELQFQWLCVNEPGVPFTDKERFLRQFFRANVEPTERYVLSVAGSTKFRLDPANPGYENLVLAGDWVANGLALGCVESAVLGGMKGVQRFCPGMQIVE